MFDPCSLNILDAGRYLCPVCGYAYSDAPAYDEAGGIIGRVICACCLWEPGFDDDPFASGKGTQGIMQAVRDYRAVWEGEAAWRGQVAFRPHGFDGRAQVARLRVLAPHLA